jgi:hypothetical protein
MNYTKGPWAIKIKSNTTYGGTTIGQHKYLSIDDDTGPILIVDAQDRAIATVVHREGKGKGFSETACNARLIENAPDVFNKAEELVRVLRAGQDYNSVLKDLETLQRQINGVVSSL